MWQKYYRIAERQLDAGKLKTVEGHALKALQYARAANHPQQIADSLSLLSKYYIDTKNHLAGETLRQSVGAVEQAYGSQSIQLAEQLELLACVLEFEPDLEAAEQARLRALSIVESSSDPEVLLDSLDMLVEFYIDSHNFAKAEIYFLRSIELLKRLYGALSEEVADQVERYGVILSGLGRNEEAAQLEASLHSCPTCGYGKAHANYPADVSAILSSVEQIEAQGDLNASVDALRKAVSDLTIIDEKQKDMPADHHPFHELKLFAQGNPLRLAKSLLAQLLRAQAESGGRQDLLIKAAGYLREINSERKTLSDTLHLILTLLDLSKNDDSYYNELEHTLLHVPDCATKFYTKALAMFRRYGSTAESRSAMRAALRANRYVLQVFAEGCDPMQVPNHFSFGSKAEAQGYYLEAVRQWESTPGAPEFMAQVMARELISSAGSSR